MSVVTRGLIVAALLACAVAHADVPHWLAALDRQGRARPEETAQQLHQLVAERSPSGTELVMALTLLGRLHGMANQVEAAERVAAQIEALPPSVDRALARAGAGVVRATMLRDAGPVTRADRVIGEVLLQLPDDAPIALRIRALMLAASIKHAAGRFDDAVRLYQQAIALSDGIAPAWQSSEMRSGLAYALVEAGQVDRATEFNREAIAMAERADDPIAIVCAMTTQAIVYGALDHPDGELKSLQTAFEQARRAGAHRDEVLVLANLSDYYLRRAQYAVALEYAQKALPLARSLKYPASESLSLVNQGLALIGLRRKHEGLVSVRAGLELDQRSGALASIAATYADLGKYLERAGYAADALAAYQQHRRIDEEVFQRNQPRVLLELQEGFDNERRLRELSLLNHDNRLKAEQLRRQTLQHRLWAVGAAVGGLAVVLMVLLYRRLRESNAALAYSNERLQRQSERDPLTELANRRHFEAAMRKRAADGTLAGSVFVVDVDHFKRINDAHGHAAGDAVLVEVARRLRTTLRDDDLIVRWGGEEFLIVVRGLSPEQVEALAGRLLAVVGGTPALTPTGPIALTASIGFASFPLEPAQLAVSWQRAIDVVDAAMYLAKAHGRNRAYGVRLADVATVEEMAAVTREFEHAWRQGRVALTLLPGPQA